VVVRQPNAPAAFTSGKADNYRLRKIFSG